MVKGKSVCTFLGNRKAVYAVVAEGNIFIFAIVKVVCECYVVPVNGSAYKCVSVIVCGSSRLKDWLWNGNFYGANYMTICCISKVNIRSSRVLGNDLVVNDICDICVVTFPLPIRRIEKYRVGSSADAKTRRGILILSKPFGG